MTASSRIWPVLVIALSLGLGLLWIGAKPLWNDEASSFFAALGGLRSVFEWTAQDTHPPFYYIVLAFWLRLGESEAAMRALSAVAIAGATGFTYLTARRLFTPGTAIMAALLFAMNPTTIAMSQKARPYALQAFLVAIALWGFMAGFLDRQPRHAWLGASIAQAWRRRGWGHGAQVDLACLAYVLCGGLAMLAQHTAGFFVLACNGAMLFRLIQLRATGPAAEASRLLGNWVIAQLLLIGIWAIWLPFFLAQYRQHLTTSGLENHSIFLVSGAQLWAALSGMLGSAAVWSLRPVIFAMFMACAIPGYLILARDRSDRRLVLLVFLVPLAVCLAAFRLVHPIFGYVITTFLWLLIPYSIVLAAGIAALPFKLARFGALGLLLAADLYSARNYYATDHPPLDQAAYFIAAAQRPDDGFMVSTGDDTRKGIGYYLRHANAAGVLDVSVYGPGLVRTLESAQSHPRVWVVLPAGLRTPADLDRLGQLMPLAEERRFGDVRVMRFERPSAPPRG